MKKEIIFKATTYALAFDIDSKETSRAPLSVTVYTDRSVVTRWCGKVIKEFFLRDDLFSEEDVWHEIKPYFYKELFKLNR